MNLQEELKAMKERIAELEVLAKEEQEFPKDGDEYWYIHTSGASYNEDWEGLGVEITMLEIGNVFKTEEQAEFAVEKLKVEAELRKFSRPFEEGENNHYIFFYTDGDYIDVAYKTVCHSQGVIYFESEEKAKQAIEAVGIDRIEKYIFGTED